MTATDIGTPIQIYVPFAKIDKKERMVYGYVSSEDIDADGEIIEQQAVRNAWDAYAKFGNLREMHENKAAGKMKVYEFLDDGRTYAGFKVSNDQAWRKVEEEVYTGFSLGGKKLQKQGNHVTDLRLTEISLVDRPNNPTSLVTLWKLDGADEKLEEEEDVGKLELVEIGDDLKKMVLGMGALGMVVPHERLAKGLFTASEMVNMLDRLHWMRESVRIEEAKEGHEGYDQEMSEALTFFANLTMKYLAEQVVEALGPDPLDRTGEGMYNGEELRSVSAAAEKLAKRGAKFSKQTKEMLVGVVDQIGKLIGKQAPEKPEGGVEDKGGQKAVDEKTKKSEGPSSDKEVSGGVSSKEGLTITVQKAYKDMTDEDMYKAWDGMDDDARKKMMDDYPDEAKKMGDTYEKMRHAEKVAGSEDLKKVEGLTAENADLKKKLEKSQEREADLKKQVIPPKTAAPGAIKVPAISKEGDGEQGQELQKLATQQIVAQTKGDARTLIKMQHKGTFREDLMAKKFTKDDLKKVEESQALGVPA